MTANSQIQSAKVYVFPKGGRDGMSRFERQVKAAWNAPGAKPMLPTFGEAWYHEEAIRDSSRKQ